MRRWVTALLVSLLASPSFAWVYYPSRGGPYRYEAIDTLPTTGAALGPWKCSFLFGGGPTPVLGNAHNRLENGWNFNMGAGYNFTPRIGLNLEFFDSGFGLSDSRLQEDQAIDGDAHIWSVTFDPIWRFRIGGPVGGYLIGGGGYYALETRLTESANIFVPTFNGGFVTPGFVDVTQTNNTCGLNVGVGLTCNMGWGTKFFVETRYHHLFTSGGGTDILPVIFGLRW